MVEYNPRENPAELKPKSDAVALNMEPEYGRYYSHYTSTTASQTKRRLSTCGDFRQKQPIPKFLKRRAIAAILKFVT